MTLEEYRKKWAQPPEFSKAQEEMIRDWCSVNAGQNPNPNGCLLIDGPRYGMVIWDHGAEEPQDHVRHRHVGYFLIKTTEMLIDLAQGQTHEPIIDSGKKKFDA